MGSIHYHIKDLDFLRIDVSSGESKAYLEEELKGDFGPYNLPSEFKSFSEERLEHLTEEELERLKFFVLEQLYVENNVIMTDVGKVVKNYTERRITSERKNILFDPEGNVFREFPKKN